MKPYWIAGSVLLVAFGLLVVARQMAPGLLVRLIVGQVGPALPGGGGLIVGDPCPSCRRPVTLRPGQEARCPGCGARLAACGRCGKWLAGPDLAAGEKVGESWFCPEHRAEEAWERGQIREFDSPTGRALPAETPRSTEARRLIEADVHAFHAAPGADRESPFADPLPIHPRRWEHDIAALPASVKEAYGFYFRAVLERDNGTPSVHRRDLAGRPCYLVRCSTDGAGGFLELFDDDGTPLGHARTEWDCPAWTSRGLTRRRAFAGDRDEVDDRVAEAVRRLKGP